MERERLESGLIQVYTGHSKGKTTAALGLTLRAVGRGFHVYIIQFMKGRQNYGETEGLKRLQPLCQVEGFGAPGWVHKNGAKPEDIREAQRGLARAREIIQLGDWDLVILDEIINAIWFKLLPEEEVLQLLDLKPDHVELVLTGRNASQKLKDRADLVTEMLQIKHPYEKGISARKGIEY